MIKVGKIRITKEEELIRLKHMVEENQEGCSYPIEGLLTIVGMKRTSVLQQMLL